MCFQSSLASCENPSSKARYFYFFEFFCLHTDSLKPTSPFIDSYLSFSSLAKELPNPFAIWPSTLIPDSPNSAHPKPFTSKMMPSQSSMEDFHSFQTTSENGEDNTRATDNKNDNLQ